MKRTLRVAVILVAVLVSLPMAILGGFSFANTVLTAALFNGWTAWLGIWALWWLGVWGAIWLCALITQPQIDRRIVWPASLLGIGLFGAELLNLRGAGDRSWHISFPTAVIPYVALVLLGIALRMISNSRWSGP